MAYYLHDDWADSMYYMWRNYEIEINNQMLADKLASSIVLPNMSVPKIPFLMGGEEIEKMIVTTNYKLKIKKVIYNDPATIIIWRDGTKTVVKCDEDDIYDPDKGFMLCVVKKLLGNKGRYNNELRRWSFENMAKEDEDGK